MVFQAGDQKEKDEIQGTPKVVTTIFDRQERHAQLLSCIRLKQIVVSICSVLDGHMYVKLSEMHRNLSFSRLYHEYVKPANSRYKEKVVSSCDNLHLRIKQLNRKYQDIHSETKFAVQISGHDDISL